MKRFRQILVIDPDDHHADALQRMLAQIGAESVVRSISTSRARTMVTITSFDLAFLSLGVPESELRLVLRDLDDRGVPVVLLSGPEESLSGYESGGLRMKLVRPFSIEALETTVVRAF